MLQQKKAEDYTIELQAKAAVLMQQIATRNGFLQYYYRILPKCSSQKAAFLVVNCLYELLFNEEMYQNYDAFRKFKNKDLKK